MRNLTGYDKAVVDKVMGTEGVPEFTEELAVVIARLGRKHDVVVALGCQGGWHRAPVIARQVAKILTRRGYGVQVEHRDVGQARHRSE